MASLGSARDTESTNNSVAALGLRRAALRGMLGSPLIEAEDQKDLREELLTELQSVGQSMARVNARNAVEICAKLDALGEEYRATSDSSAAQDLIASIRRDVVSLFPRPVEMSRMQAVRTLHTGRPLEPPLAPSAPQASSGESSSS